MSAVLKIHKWCLVQMFIYKMNLRRHIVFMIFPRCIICKSVHVNELKVFIDLVNSGDPRKFGSDFLLGVP